MSDAKGKGEAPTGAPSGPHSFGKKEGGSSGSNGGNNSDNSALVSLGNSSFGFNFDSEGGMNSAPNSDDSDGQAKSSATAAKTSLGDSSNAVLSSHPSTLKSSVSSLTAGSNDASHHAAAADAVAGLQTISKAFQKGEQIKTKQEEEPKSQRKRKGSHNESPSESVGYNSEVDFDSQSGNARADADEAKGGKPAKKKKGNDRKREERNAREKERSFRISKQINELRDLLSSGGIIVPKGTKSSVLTEAASYIRMLQQHQYRSEIDRHQLVQQMQLIGSGAHGPQAATAIRHVAAQNGVWSLGNFGGVPPKSSMSFYQAGSSPEEGEEGNGQSSDPNALDVPEYRNVFNSCGIGMALASMGGAFIDANQLFCQLCSYSKQELCSLTIFNLTARQDLQHAFDLISQMISPPVDLQGKDNLSKQVVLRGTMKDRTDLGLSISLIKGTDGIAKCFCVTLIKSPSSPFDTSKPVPVSFESILQDPPILPTATPATTPETLKAESINNAAPTFTSG